MSATNPETPAADGPADPMLDEIPTIRQAMLYAIRLIRRDTETLAPPCQIRPFTYRDCLPTEPTAK